MLGHSCFPSISSDAINAYLSSNMQLRSLGVFFSRNCFQASRLASVSSPNVSYSLPPCLHARGLLHIGRTPLGAWNPKRTGTTSHSPSNVAGIQHKARKRVDTTVCHSNKAAWLQPNRDTRQQYSSQTGANIARAHALIVRVTPFPSLSGNGGPLSQHTYLCSCTTTLLQCPCSPVPSLGSSLLGPCRQRRHTLMTCDGLNPPSQH